MEFTDTPFAFDLQLEQEFQRFVEAYTVPCQVAGPSNPPTGFPLVDDDSLTMPRMPASFQHFSEMYTTPHQMAGPSNPPTGFPLVDNDRVTMPRIIDSPASFQHFSETYTAAHQMTGPSNPPIDFRLVNNAMPHIGSPFSSNAYLPFFNPVAPNADFTTPQGMATPSTRDRFMNRPGQAIRPMDGFEENVPSMDGPTFAMGMSFQSSAANEHPSTFTTPQGMTAPPTQGTFFGDEGLHDPVVLHLTSYVQPRGSSQSPSAQDPPPIHNPVEDLGKVSAGLPNARIPVRTGTHYLREKQRIKILENDPYVVSFTPTEVECGGCGKTIQLDNRARYYPHLWTKHRSRCVGIVGRRGRKSPRKTS